jgi:hypothetical protein
MIMARRTCSWFTDSTKSETKTKRERSANAIVSALIIGTALAFIYWIIDQQSWVAENAAIKVTLSCVVFVLVAIAARTGYRR